MRLTKLEHACLIVEESGRRLVIDPGGFTSPLVGLHDVDVVVITHEHGDHWSPDQLREILATSPGALIVGPPGVATAAADFTVQTVAEGDTIEVGPFTLAFAGSRHAVIHESLPVIDNVGVLVNGRLFYPGDALTVPGFPVDTLAVPVGAPWLKISEAMDYVTAVIPARTFPTHEGTLSEVGLRSHADRIKGATEALGSEALLLRPHESVEL
ncbi:MBL fold metallo-hydrolase [Frigoribacterium sp. 2-23]|uniref:MBL fold metallo-hydrolase n=1 Tax=Frigoribacterium sp. 2-23 TaxID=3415006 RepID=UPI003C6F72F3